MARTKAALRRVPEGHVRPKLRTRKRTPVKAASANEAAIAATLPQPVVTHRHGNQSTYDPVVAARIITEFAEGKTLRAACELLGHTPPTFHEWMLAHAELRDLWETARRIKATSLVDLAQSLADRLDTNSANYGAGDASKVNALRTAIETYKWIAGKLNPQDYGDKSLVLPHIAIQIVTPLDLGKNDDEPRLEDGSRFTYSIAATIPEALPPSAEIIPGESGPKRVGLGGRARPNPFLPGGSNAPDPIDVGSGV